MKILREWGADFIGKDNVSKGLSLGLALRWVSTTLKLRMALIL